MIRAAFVIAFALSATACQTSQAGLSASPHDQFVQAFASGADCPQLFELRNVAKASGSDSRAEEMNEKLGSVRCFSATSKRAPNTVRDGAFTV